MISFRVFAHGDLDNRSKRAFLRLRQPRVSDIGLDSEIASETSADSRRLVTRAYPAFALSASDGCDGGCSSS